MQDKSKARQEDTDAFLVMLVQLLTRFAFLLYEFVS